MSKRDEDYLDHLLSSVSDETKGEWDFPEDSFEHISELGKSAERESLDALFQVEEDDFIKEIEGDLAEEDADTFLEEFEAEMKAIRESDSDDFLSTDADMTNASLDVAAEQAMSKGVTEKIAEEVTEEEPFSSEEEELSVEEEPSADIEEEALSPEEIISGALNHMNGTATGDDAVDAALNEAGADETSLAGDDISEGLMEEPALGEDFMGEPDLSESSMEEPDLSEGSVEEPSLGEAPMEELPLTEDGEGDLSGNSDEDLLSLLSGEGGLDDIGSLLSADESDAPVDGEDSIGAFAEKEMQSAEAQIEAGTEETEEGKKKEKKPGLLKRILAALFKEPEEATNEEAVELSMDASVDIQELSDENMQILRELEAAEGGGEEAKEEDDKKKKKKEKKEKKEKPKKEKKPKEKKEKKPKEKKEKKPFFNDPSPKLPKLPVILILICMASLTFMVMLFINLQSYRSSISYSKAYYATAAQDPEKYQYYIKAYEQLVGVEIKPGDEELYKKIEIVAVLADAYRDYEVFAARNDQVTALDNLICVIGRYEVNYDSAELFHCEAEMKQLDEMATTALSDKYGMSRSEAVELYKHRTRKDYSKALYLKLVELGLE